MNTLLSIFAPAPDRIRRTRRRPAAVAIAVALAALLHAPAPVQAEPGQSKEYAVKAVFLFNFMQFTEWPESAFGATNAPLLIGILGQDPFGDTLDKVVKNESVNGRAIVVKRAKKVDELQDCHALFVCKSERAQIPAILSACGNRPVLTLGEVDGFAARGGAINFFIKSDKVRFQINAAEARRRGLKISSELLKIAEIVQPEASRETP